MIKMSKASKKETFSGCFLYIIIVLGVGFLGVIDSTTNERRSYRAAKSVRPEHQLKHRIETTLEDDLISSLSDPFFQKAKEPKTNRNLLHLACLTNKPEFAKKLLDEGFAVNEKDARNNTPIMLALYGNSPECVELLMKYSPDLKPANRSGMLAAHPAARYGYFSVVKESIRQGINLSDTDGGGYSPLHLAAREGHLDIVVLLCENGADVSATRGVGWTPGDLSFSKHKDVALYLQSRNGRFSKEHLKMEFNLFNGWPLPELKEISTSTTGPAQPLFVAALADDITSLKNLAVEGKSFDVTSDSGTPLLCFAIVNKKFAAAEFIIENIKNFDAKDAIGRTALIHAILSGNEDLALKLLDKSADPNLRDMTGNVALLYAVKEWQNKLVPALLKAGAEVFAKNRLEQGPLHFAVESFNLQIVEFLINNGCDVNLEDIHGDTPLHVAARLGNEQLINKLLKNGANPWHRNLAGKAPLELVPAEKSALRESLMHRSEIEGINPIEKAPAEVDLSLPLVPYPPAEETK